MKRSYDEAGNITKISKQQEEWADISKLTDALMTYDAQNRMLTYNGETIEYDADGNMTYGTLVGVMTRFTYDCRNRLVQAGDCHYEYNSENVRISAQNKETKWSYLVDPQATFSQILITETYEKNLLGQFTKLTGSTLYTYGRGLISESSEKNGFLVYHFDQLGSTKRITDKDGKTVYTMNYGSYGELFGIQDAKGNLVNFKDNPIAFLYNGQYGIVTDQNTLTYMRARYYNPEIKRFLNQDVLTGSIGNSQSLNRYSYVQGNPIRFTDPFGLCPDGSGVASPKQIWDYIKDAWKTQKGMSLFSSKEERRAAHREVNARHAEAAATVNRAIDAAKQSYKDMTWQEKAHLWLGVAGFIPVIGVAADFVDGCIYLSEGKVGDALFSIGCAAAGLIVGIDQVSNMMKLARMGSKVNKAANVGSLIKVSSNIEDFAGIGHEGSFLQDVIKGVGVSGDAADGVRTANHAADGIKGANNAVDATKSASNVGEAVGGSTNTKVPDFIVTPEGVVMPTNQDFNLVSTTLPTNKGGDYLQIHNSHTHGTLTDPHGHKPQVNINPNTGVGNTIRKDFEVFSDTINRADKELRDGTMRIRTGRKDLGGIKN